MILLQNKSLSDFSIDLYDSDFRFLSPYWSTKEPLGVVSRPVVVYTEPYFLVASLVAPLVLLDFADSCS